MVFETTLCRRLPAVSARGIVILAALGVGLLTVGLAAGTAVLAPAGAVAAWGLLAGLRRTDRVRRYQAYAREGTAALLAATFMNGVMVAFIVLASLFLLRFGA